jgi:preprotein translocase subunit SecY
VKKFIQTIKNIWSIDELRSKIIVTLALLFTYRLGTFIVLPGINPNLLASAQANASQNGLLGLFDTFAGGAFSQAFDDYSGSSTSESAEGRRKWSKEN